MTAFVVVKVDGDIPERVAIAASQAFAGVVSAWHGVSGTVEPGSFIELLGVGGDEPEGPGRRRKAVLDRLYADVDGPGGDGE